jgi:acyl-CoA thioester hydrolase
MNDLVLDPGLSVLLAHSHVYVLRVYYEDTDSGKIVYHSNYLKFAERGRTEMLRLLGFDSTLLEKDYQLAPAVYSLDIKYLKPAALDDKLLVETFVEQVSGASMILKQKIMLIKGQVPILDIANVNLKIVLLNKKGSLRRFPTNIKIAINDLIIKESSKL